MEKILLNPWYITGLSDSEGTFSCYIQRETTNKITVSLEFKITLAQAVKPFF